MNNHDNFKDGNVVDNNINNENVVNNSTKPNSKFEVPIYTDLLNPNRKNVKIPGFSFDVDVFEDLIDCFTPIQNIPTILDTDIPTLDKFCDRAYGMNFKETYAKLSGITDYWSRKVIKNLSSSGNSTALNIMSKHFMGLSDDNKNQGVNITIVNDMKEDD